MRPMDDPGNVADATAIVLAGGKSSRMGTPKAWLLFDHEPLIVHIVSSLRRRFAEVVVVAAPGQELPSLPATVVHDDVAHQGPVGGICYGLAAAGGALAFVTSCDSAFLSLPLVTYLLSQASGFDVVVPHWEDRLQPLHAVYRRSVLPLLEAQLARRELRPVYLFDKVRTRTVGEDEIRRFDPEGASFFNMNTPEDYAEALRRWARATRHSDPDRDDSIQCSVELFGVARLTASTRIVPLTLPADATLSDVFAALAERLPALLGRVITQDGHGLIDGYACNVNGLDFIRSASARVNPGDNIIILSADAGG
jgi:molybdopterin-guanine dinucleotide biosynthesis protein A